jgi:hypothetical protein
VQGRERVHREGERNGSGGEQRKGERIGDPHRAQNISVPVPSPLDGEDEPDEQ